MTAVEQAVRPPAPAPDAESRFYWDGLRAHRLLLQRCTECERVRFPPLPACPYCADPGTEVIEASGRGRLYSWVVVYRPFDPAFTDDVPYTVATVDLAEGGRLVGRLEDMRVPSIDADVEILYVDHDDWTEARFRPARKA